MQKVNAEEKRKKAMEDYEIQETRLNRLMELCKNYSSAFAPSTSQSNTATNTATKSATNTATKSATKSTAAGGKRKRRKSKRGKKRKTKSRNFRKSIQISFNNNNIKIYFL